MLTIRIGCFHDRVDDSDSDPAITDESKQQWDTTMLTVDEDDYYDEEDTGEIPNLNPSPDAAFDPFEELPVESDPPLTASSPGDTESPNRPTGTLQEDGSRPDPPNPSVRSSQRILRRNRRRRSENDRHLNGTTKTQHGNYLASTSLYSIGYEDDQQSFLLDSDDEEIPNVDLCLNAPNKLLSRFEAAEAKLFGSGRWSSDESEDEDGDNDSQQQHRHHRRRHRHRKSLPPSSPASGKVSTNDQFVEVDRVRERLKGIKARRYKLVEKPVGKSQRELSAVVGGMKLPTTKW